MAFKRSKLKALGLTDEQIDAVMDEHIEVVNEITAERDKYKADAEKLPEVQKQLNEGGDYKTKYEQEHQAFEDFKATTSAAATKSAKTKLYKESLKKAGIDDKWIDPIMRLADLDKIEIKDGKYANEKAVDDQISADYSDYVKKGFVKGTDPATPPGQKNEIDLGELGMAEYIAARKKQTEV